MSTPPQTLPADFKNWDKPPEAKLGVPPTLPANFSGWDEQPTANGWTPVDENPESRWTPPVEEPGEQTNDVGNKVIVPAEGESFQDTMRRAARYGKTVTGAQINAEMATAPKKAAWALGSAPLAGLLGAGGLAAASVVAPPVARALAPIAKKYGIKVLEGAGLGMGYELYRELKKVFEGE